MTWECELPDGEPYYLHWPRSEFGNAIGVKKSLIPPGGIPVRLLLGDPEHDIPPFLENMRGKEFDLVIEQVEMDEPMTEADTEDFIDEARHFLGGLRGGKYKPSINPEGGKQ